jgi:hypothetical protein
MRRILQKTPGRRAQRNQSLAVLKAIITEIAGYDVPYSSDSYLPEHLIEAAKQAIQIDEREDR